MDPLLRDLKTRGVLDDAAADWATAHQARTRSTLDSALLELDLIDEDSLLGALGVRFDLPAAEPGDLDTVDPEAALQFSAATSRSFGMCPVFVRGGKLVAFVASPLPTEQRQQLRDSYALEIEQLVVPVHYLALAWDQAYGIPVDERTHELEIRLERRRSALGVREVLEKVASASRLSAAVDCVLDFAACLVEASGFLVYREDELRVAQTRGSSLVPGTPVPLAESGCTLGAAIRHGGYFFGPLIGTEADRSFYKALERTLPQRAFVAPVPITKGISVVFCADNGPRGIASRWAAELTVLVSRLGWEPGDWEARWRGRSWSEATHEKAPEEPTQEESESEPSPVERQAADALGAAGFVSKEVPERSEESAPAPPVEASEQPSTPTTLEEPGVDPPRELDEAPATNLTPAQTAVEQAVLDRLKRAAAGEGMLLEVFVEGILSERESRASSESTAAIVDEVKGLFEKLATDIPTQMARGMETAFRDLVPRLGRASASSPDPGQAAAARTGAPKIALVRKEAGPREVQSYRSRRRKSKRVKL